MNLKKQEITPENDLPQVISPLAKDLTYGEKKYDRIFNFDINFMVNLLSSAAFTTWMSHARTPIKLPFAKEKIAPYMIQKSWATAINKLPIMELFGGREASARNSVAKTMAGILSLTAAGHFVMIPSVWLGSKFKSPLVEKWDREHYGDAAMDDPSLKLRHAMVEAEERPTLFGAIAGRLGTIFATQLTGYTVGNGNNIPRMLGNKFPMLSGLKKFPGLDAITESLGSKVGSVMTETLPGTTKKVNDVFAKNERFGWSNIQLDTHPELKGIPYGTTTANNLGGGIPEHFGRNLVADILYTTVTASTITPAINFLKRYIPGITYKPKISEETQRILDSASSYTPRPRPVRPFVIRDAATDLSAATNDNFNAVNDNPGPHTQISDIKNHTMLSQPEQHIVHAG